MDKVERGWNEFWAEIFRVQHRRAIQGIEQFDQLLVKFIIEAKGPTGLLSVLICQARSQGNSF